MFNSLFKELKCPNCKSNLELKNIIKNKDNKISSGELLCKRCNDIFYIKNGIPRFVKSDSYTDNFSFEWEKHSRTQLDIDKEYSKNTFFKVLGLDKKELEGIKVLDAGVGPGRFAYIPINNKATFHGVDLSNAVIQAKNNYSNVSNALFVQTDLTKLPYPKNYFDFIYSIGVLHHTPNPKLSFLSLVKYLKPGGSIAISIYNKGSLLYEYAKRLRKYSVNISTHLNN